MTSSLLYKFKASNQQNSVHFQGPHIQLNELRAQIIRDGKITQGRDFFDLELSNAQTGEIYSDRALVPRNTAVLVRRVPVHNTAPIESTIAGAITSVGMSPRLGPQNSFDLPDAEDESAGAEGAAEKGGAGTSTAPAPASGSTALTAGDAGSASAVPLKPAPRPVLAGGNYAAKLVCPLSNSLFVDAVIVTCCGTSFSKQVRRLAKALHKHTSPTERHPPVRSRSTYGSQNAKRARTAAQALRRSSTCLACVIIRPDHCRDAASVIDGGARRARHQRACTATAASRHPPTRACPCAAGRCPIGLCARPSSSSKSSNRARRRLLDPLSRRPRPLARHRSSGRRRGSLPRRSRGNVRRKTRRPERAHALWHNARVFRVRAAVTSVRRVRRSSKEIRHRVHNCGNTDAENCCRKDVAIHMHCRHRSSAACRHRRRRLRLVRVRFDVPGHIHVHATEKATEETANAGGGYTHTHTT